MGTITVKNAAGDNVDLTLPNDDGRAAAAASSPVVLSDEDKAALDAVTTGLTALAELLPAALGASGGLKISGSGTALPVEGEFFQATQPVSADALPLPAGAATADKQPAIGTAGAASSDVVTIQGVAGMTPLEVDGSGVTQPVSGPVTDAEMRAAPLPVMEPWSEYEAVPAGSTDQAAGATGAAGDYLSHIVIQPTTTSIGDVVVKDGATTIFTRTGGDTLPDLSPITVPFGVKSKNGAWEITTGANVAVLACGDFA